MSTHSERVQRLREETEAGTFLFTRWPQQEKALDLVAHALVLSAALNAQGLFTVGRRLESVALAVLDALDPQGDD